MPSVTGTALCLPCRSLRWAAASSCAASIAIPLRRRQPSTHGSSAPSLGGTLGSATCVQQRHCSSSSYSHPPAGGPSTAGSNSTKNATHTPNEDKEKHDEDSLPDYFFDLRPDDAAAATAAAAAPPPPSPPSFPTRVPSSTPPPPPPPHAPHAGLAEDRWSDFQAYLEGVHAADPDFLAFARAYDPSLTSSSTGTRTHTDQKGGAVSHGADDANSDRERRQAEMLEEVAHLLGGSSGGGGGGVPYEPEYEDDDEGVQERRRGRHFGEERSRGPRPAAFAAPPPPMDLDELAELDRDLAAAGVEEGDVELSGRDGEGAAESQPPPLWQHDGAYVKEFGDDAAADDAVLTALKGRAVRLQNTADTVTPPLRIPDKDGQVRQEAREATQEEGEEGSSSSGVGRRRGGDTGVSDLVRLPTSRMLSAASYLVQQDRLYLSPQTPPAAQLRPPHQQQQHQQQQHPCVLVVFSANDLRVHDNHLLALASVRARAAAEALGHPLPVIAVCVLDYRTFAQPSVVGGFFRQSPQRARFMLDTVAALRHKLEGELHVPLIVRCGRPEEHVPRLAVELAATDVFVTTQYAPHERRVQALMLRRLRKGVWVSRADVADDEHLPAAEKGEADDEVVREAGGNCDDAPLVAVVEHPAAQSHPYGPATPLSSSPPPPPVVHSVWQTTLVHLDDLPTPLAAMKEGERWYHDDVTVSTIRPTEPYDKSTEKLSALPLTWQHTQLLPPREETEGRAAASVLRGAIPTLQELGYSEAAVSGVAFAFEDVIATQSSHPTAGEDAALARMQAWLAEGGMTSLLRFGRERRTNTKLYSQKLARVSPYIAVGALSPRKYYEVLRQHAHEQQRDGFVQQQFREGLLRLSRRDYWHWMGLRFGDRLFYSYGPHPEQTDGVPDWRHDAKVVQRWCNAQTGIPFADAAMRELLGTGFVAHEGRQALAWLLTRGYGQDWRLGAEWLERCSLDFDPFVCYGNYAYSCGLLLDDFGEPVRNVHFLAHQHDQTGIYIKKWLPQLSKVPPVYVHRPHVLTPRMQAMHGVYLGKNYPYPLKLWQGAQRTLLAEELAAYSAKGIGEGPGYAEAARCGAALLPPEEWSAAVTPAYVQPRAWTDMLPASAFADVSLEASAGMEEAEEVGALVLTGGAAKKVSASSQLDESLWKRAVM